MDRRRHRDIQHGRRHAECRQHERPERSHSASRGHAGRRDDAFDWYIANHPDEMLNIRGAENKSWRELSPDFTGRWQANVPYIDDMMSTRSTTRAASSLSPTSLTNPE